nr:PREDICTED: ATP-dependent DNA helicase PIF1 [Bemisia tabaci]
MTSSLNCSGVIQWLTPQKTVTKSVKAKAMIMQLVRNEFRELFLCIAANKANYKYQLTDFQVHKNFIHEGKATINFMQLNISVLISNAPPTHLLTFLKVIFIKVASAKKSPKTSARNQLLSTKQQMTEEISPVNPKDINRTQSQAKEKMQRMPAAELRKKLLKAEKQKQEQNKKGLVTFDFVSELSKEQKRVLDAVSGKRNIFFTGSAGTGKSYLLRCILNSLPPDVTVATASTGAAACLVGGVTLHSFAGIGGGTGTLEHCYQLASRPQVVQNWRKCKNLVIDEISMVDGDYFDKIEAVARRVRNSDAPFGGIKLILCGDFLQLPPVAKDSKTRFCFQSEAWSRCELQCFNLKEVHRQSDPEFINMLNNIRVGRVTPEVSDRLIATARNNLEKDGIVPTQLCCRTREAEQINETKLAELQGEMRKFEARDSGNSASLDDQTRVSKTLCLKVGAQVMLLKNVSVTKGLVNGARGVVSKFSAEGHPVVVFCSGESYTCKPEKWFVKTTGGGVITRIQIPLQLAWAFSIHKSQGLTLDCVEMALSGVFEAGQAYVALSRAQSLDTLRVVDFDPKQVWANPDVLKFYRQLNRVEGAMDAVRVGVHVR